jgi:hypothetical protein
MEFAAKCRVFRLMTPTVRSRRSLFVPEDQPLLNEHQRRHFEVLLAGLEDTLASIEELAARTDHVEAAGLTRYEPDLPPGFGAAIRPVLTELRARTTRLAARLGLRGQSRSVAQSIRAMLVAEMVRLEDSTSAQLRGYGAVDPRVKDVIEPELRALHALLAAINGRLSASRAGGDR